MKKVIKTFLTLFLVILSPVTTSFSQITYNGIGKDSVILITKDQLKETNLIFAEHKKLLTDNTLLLEQVSLYKEDNQLLSYSDSIKTLQINNYENLSNLYIDKIDDLTHSLKKKNTSLLVWKIGGITVGVGLIIWLILK